MMKIHKRCNIVADYTPETLRVCSDRPGCALDVVYLMPTQSIVTSPEGSARSG